MKKILVALPLATLALALAQPAFAQGTAPAKDEWQRNQNMPAPKTGTSESRSTERKARRAEMKAANKAGEIPEAGEDWGHQAPQKPAGTHETRSAERKVKRAEMKQSVKDGTMPVTTEAEVSKVPTATR